MSITTSFPRAPPSPDEIKRHNHRRRRHAHAPDVPRHSRIRKLRPVTAAQMAIATKTPLPQDDDAASVAARDDLDTNVNATAIVQLCVAMTSLVAMGFVMVVLERFV